jgi:transcriptional regulator with PAS, ATPase and Fis domain
VGGTKPVSINVRIITATNVNLEKSIAEGTFREDLYYRLNRMPIHIPPLRKRLEDINHLCVRLIQKINQDYGRNIEGISTDAIQKLMHYDWPGNVRELENVLGRAIIFMKNSETWIESHHLPELCASNHNDNKLSQENNKDETLAVLMDQHEKKILQNTLENLAGNKTKTARKLGISVRNLYYKLEKYQLE